MIKNLAHYIRRAKIFWLTDAPISKLRFDTKKCYVIEGFGGEEITRWPVFGFYALYIAGKTEEAERQYINWYIDQFHKYGVVSKAEGGMLEGSLYRLVRHLHEERGFPILPPFNEKITRAAIQKRVRQRFQLVDSLRREYKPKDDDLIHGVRKNGLVYLLNGHHRTAILILFGYTVIPGVFVLPEWLYTIKKYFA